MQALLIFILKFASVHVYTYVYIRYTRLQEFLALGVDALDLDKDTIIGSICFKNLGSAGYDRWCGISNSPMAESVDQTRLARSA